MATLDELHDALIQADAAGDHESAQALADHIRGMQGTAPAPTFDTPAASSARGLPPNPAAQPVAHTGYRAQVNRTMSGNGPQSRPLTNPNSLGTQWNDVAGGAVVGIPSGILGIPGDIEGITRLLASKVSNTSTQNIMPTSSDIGNMLAGKPSSPEAAGGRVLGNFMSPSFALRGANLLTRGVSSMEKFASPADQASALVLRALQRDKVSPDNAAQAMSQFGAAPRPSPSAPYIAPAARDLQGGHDAMMTDLQTQALQGVKGANTPAMVPLPTTPIALMDVGGDNTARLARTVATLPGEGSQDMTKFLAERQADQHGRVLNDITTHFANGSDVHGLSDTLMADRATASKPLYDQAFRANQSIASPKIDRILETPAGKQALASARVKMQNDMTLMGVPDAELRDQALEAGQALPGGAASGLKLRTLDYMKRSLDDQIGAAQRAGESDNARILTGLKKDFVKALDDADVTARAGPNSTKAAGGLYAQARAAYSGPSQSIDALTDGQDFLKMAPETLASKLADLPASDRDFFRVGAARALQDKVSKAADNHDAVTRVFGNKTIRDQISAVFGAKATQQFSEAASAERMATATNRFVTGGSNTMNKAADIADTGSRAAEDAVKGFLIGGPKGAIGLPALNFAKGKAADFFSQTSPEIRAQLSRILTGQSVPTQPLRGANLAPGALNNRNIAAMLSPQILSQLLLQSQSQAR